MGPLADGSIHQWIRSNVLGLAAIFIALSGTAWAAQQIGAQDIARNAVRAKHIKGKQVRAKHLGKGAVTAAALGEGAVGTVQLAGGAVNAAKVAANSLTGAQIDESSLGQVPAAGQADSAADAALLGGQGPGAFAASSHPHAAADITSGTLDKARVPDTFGAVLTGRLDPLEMVFQFVSSIEYGSPNGTSAPNSVESAVTHVSPAQDLRATDLSVRWSSVAGSGVVRGITLRVNGESTVLGCFISGPFGVTCVDPDDDVVAVPAGSTISLESTTNAASNPAAANAAMFAFRLIP